MSVRIGQKTITYKKITKNFRLRNWPYFVCFVLQNLTSNISLSRWEKFRGLFQLKIRGLFFLKFSFWAYKKPNYYTTYSHTIFFIISLIMTLFLIVRNPFFIFFIIFRRDLEPIYVYLIITDDGATSPDHHSQAPLESTSNRQTDRLPYVAAQWRFQEYNREVKEGTFILGDGRNQFTHYNKLLG